jgi:hypothetical protein
MLCPICPSLQAKVHIIDQVLLPPANQTAPAVAAADGGAA